MDALDPAEDLPVELNPLLERTDAFERYGYQLPGPLVLSCEHASNRLPPPLVADASDREILETHWGCDIGARGVTLGLARHTRASAVLSRFSRLVCDPNRHPHRPDLVLEAVEGVALSFNRHLDEVEVASRLERFHAPYHDALDRALAPHPGQPPPALLLAIHSFTPVWDRRLRTIDIGVLFDEEEDLASRLASGLSEAGFFVAMNAPYSAKGTGLMYAAERHGRRHGVRHLELELNQALICTPERQRRVAARVGEVLRGLLQALEG